MDLGALCKRVSHQHCRVVWQAAEPQFVLQNIGCALPAQPLRLRTQLTARVCAARTARA
jgi:hypothetical protein